MSDWINVKVEQLMKFIEKTVNETADGMYKNEPTRRTATYIIMWKKIMQEVDDRKDLLSQIEEAEKKNDSNMEYWLSDP